jgi:hypothetical protein
MKASDLDYYQRQQLIGTIREKIGADKYLDLLTQMDEDEILNYFLKAQDGNASSSSDESSSPWTGILVAVVLGIFFIVVYFQGVLPALSGPKSPSFWAYLGAIPLTALWIWVYLNLGNIFVWIFTYLSIPAVSVGAAYFLIKAHLSIWAVPVGVVACFVGTLCARRALKKTLSAREWALNGLMGWAFGIGTILAGLAAHFIWHL